MSRLWGIFYKAALILQLFQQNNKEKGKNDLSLVKEKWFCAVSVSCLTCCEKECRGTTEGMYLSQIQIPRGQTPRYRFRETNTC